MDNDVILSQFDDLEEKVEFLIGLCKTLEVENERLKNRIEILESDVKNKSDAEIRISEQKDKIRIKISGLLEKLNEFSEIST